MLILFFTDENTADKTKTSTDSEDSSKVKQEKMDINDEQSTSAEKIVKCFILCYKPFNKNSHLD